MTDIDVTCCECGGVVSVELTDMSMEPPYAKVCVDCRTCETVWTFVFPVAQENVETRTYEEMEAEVKKFLSTKVKGS